MRIAILGTRGIPNHHGGFEQFAEYFSAFAAEKGHDVFVYNSSLHPYKDKRLGKVEIIHCKDWEDKLGTFGQFIYDLNCILDSRKRNFDIILQLGYTSNSIWCWLLPKKSCIVTNMDGLEWKRTKYHPLVRRFLKFAEKLALNSSDYLIADSIGIQDYLDKTYNASSEFIPYGAEIPMKFSENSLSKFNLKPFDYHLLIARIEPENNLETIIDGFLASNSAKKLVVVGNTNSTKHGKKLRRKFEGENRLLFTGAIYDSRVLNDLRYFSDIYFHGHSVGGTNPSLLEAMACSCLIIAHKNVFNQSILGEDAFYFNSSEDIKTLLNDSISKSKQKLMYENNLKKIKEQYNWELINQKYLSFLEGCYHRSMMN